MAPEPDTAGRDRTWPSGTTLAVALGAGLVGGVLVAGAWAVFGDNGGSSSTSTSTCTVTDIADRVLPSVVTLHVSGSQGSGTGSGVVVKTPLPGASGSAPA